MAARAVRHAYRQHGACGELAAMLWLTVGALIGLAFIALIIGALISGTP